MPLNVYDIVERRTSARTLTVTRVLVGIAAALASWEAWRMLSRMLRPLVVRIPVAAWIPLLPSSALPLFIAVWFIAALAFLAGWRTRIAGAVLTLLTGYTLVLDQQTYSNHLYLLFLVLLLMTIAYATEARSEVAAWPLLLLKVQLVIVYVFSALAKLTPPYLSGEVLTRSLKADGWLAIPQAWQTPSAMSVLAMLSIAAELFVAFGLWSRRLRPFALLAGAGFHLIILGILDSSRLSLLIFALAMFAIYPLFSAGVPSSSAGETDA